MLEIKKGLAAGHREANCYELHIRLGKATNEPLAAKAGRF
jgi:hypothetical protein